MIGAAIEVHRHLGPGLLESIYEEALYQELVSRHVPVEKQVRLPVSYKGLPLGRSLRLDLVVDSRLIVEVKAVEQLMGIHHSQLLTYLRLTGCRLGLLINFNVPVLHKGIRRLIND